SPSPVPDLSDGKALLSRLHPSRHLHIRTRTGDAVAHSVTVRGLLGAGDRVGRRQLDVERHPDLAVPGGRAGIRLLRSPAPGPPARTTQLGLDLAWRRAVRTRGAVVGL